MSPLLQGPTDDKLCRTDYSGSISVVIPCFRCADTVLRAIESVALQSEKAAEVIAVDDFSNDDTLEALRSAARLFPEGWLKVVPLHVNQGAASARNAGWNIAMGEFVAFLDADDAWHPRKLELQGAFMRSHPDFAVSGHQHTLGTYEGPLEPELRWQEVGFNDLLWRNGFVTPSVMLRRQLPMRFREGQRYMEDHLLWLHLAGNGYRTALIALPLVRLFKKQFGESGLSSSLAEMEHAELKNYRLLRKERRIGGGMLAVLSAWSLAKYMRRLAIVGFRRLLAAKYQRNRGNGIRR